MNTLFKTLLIILVTSTLGQAKALEKVSLQLHWLDQFQFAGYYMAKKRGFYEEVGLDVTFKKYHDSINTLDEVMLENATYGVGRSSLISDRSKGVDVKLLAAIFQSSPLVILTTKESNITKIEDFKNKRVMPLSNPLDTVSLQAMANQNGIEKSDIVPLRHSFDVDDLINKKTDLMVSYISNEPFLLQEKGVDYTIFDPKDYGFDFYSDLLFTSGDEITKHPQRAKNFTAASLKGWEYAFSHIEESVELIFSKYNSQNKSKKALFFEAKALKALAYFKSRELGHINRQKIQRIYDIFNVLGYVEDEIVLDEFIYHDDNYRELDLSVKEQAWIYTHPIMRYSGVNWEPLSIIENTQMNGLMGDYLKFISQKTGIRFEFVASSSWSEVLKKFKDKHIDIIPGVGSSSQEKSLGLVSDKYTQYPMVIVTNDSYKYIENLSELQGKTIAVPADYTSHNFLKNNHRDITLKLTKSIEEALMLVNSGEADAFVGHIAPALYYLHILDLNALKISGLTSFKFEHHYLIQEEYPELLSIINKAFKSMTGKEKKDISDRWVRTTDEKEIDSTLVWQLIAGFLTILSIISYFMIKENILKEKILQMNSNLETQIKNEVSKNREKDQQLMQQSRMAQMGEMISMIAHQWRQPLGAIAASSIDLKMKIAFESFDLDKKEGQKECSEYFDGQLTHIEAYVQSLTNTIDDFRNFYKPNKEKKKVTINEPLLKSLSIIEAAAKAKGVDISTSFKSEKVLAVYDSELMQVFLNIIKNSQDNFSEKETLDAHIMIETKDTAEGIMIEVCDNGGGIPEDIKMQIFDPYFSTKDEKNGTGLGLYMSKTIIEEHHSGKLIVENRDGGACFTIMIKDNNE